MSQPHQKRVLIAGAGYVGAELARQLLCSSAPLSSSPPQGAPDPLPASWEVWGLSRSPIPDAPAGLQQIRADLTDATSLRSLPRDLTHVVYCVGSGGRDEEAYRNAYVVGLRNILEATKPHPLERFVFTSSTAVYAQTDGSWVTENSPTEPTHFSGQLTLEAEQLLHGTSQRTTALRCAGIYGPGRTRLLTQAQSGSLRLPNSDRFTNRIHRDDVALLIGQLLEDERDVPTLLACDDHPASYYEVLRTLCQLVGAPNPEVDPALPPPARGGNKRCSNQRLHQLGYHLRFSSFVEGYRALLSAATSSQD